MKTTSPCADKTASPAVQLMTMDILESVMRYSENPGRLGQYLARQVRELVGGRVVILLQFVGRTEGSTQRIVRVYPSRYAELSRKPEPGSYGMKLSN